MTRQCRCCSTWKQTSLLTQFTSTCGKADERGAKSQCRLIWRFRFSIRHLLFSTWSDLCNLFRLQDYHIGVLFLNDEYCNFLAADRALHPAFYVLLFICDYITENSLYTANLRDNDVHNCQSKISDSMKRCSVVITNLLHVANVIFSIHMQLLAISTRWCTITNRPSSSYKFALCKGVWEPTSVSNYHEINRGNPEAVNKTLRDFLHIRLQALHVPATWSELKLKPTSLYCYSTCNFGSFVKSPGYNCVCGGYVITSLAKNFLRFLRACGG